jgi:hypothetical protein
LAVAVPLSAFVPEVQMAFSDRVTSAVAVPFVRAAIDWIAKAAAWGSLCGEV